MYTDYNIYLASGSPRRRELLAMLGVDFRRAPSIDVDESYPASIPADEVAQYIARKKADAYTPLVGEGDLYITADTVVIAGDKVIGKPSSLDEARRMLRMLSGITHRVVTGVCVFTATHIECFSSTTEVEFAELSDDEINSYVEEFQPLDKAGAYGIQERIGAMAVKGLRGSFYNVMGLPVARLYEVLKSRF